MRNMTSDRARFTVSSLQPGELYELTIQTEEETVRRHVRLAGPEEVRQAQTGFVRSEVVITPVLGAMIGVGAALGVVSLTILIVVGCRGKTGRSDQEARSRKDKEDASARELSTPDLIPARGGMDEDSGFQLYEERVGMLRGEQNHPQQAAPPLNNVYIVVSRSY